MDDWIVRLLLVDPSPQQGLFIHIHVDGGCEWPVNLGFEAVRLYNDGADSIQDIA